MFDDINALLSEKDKQDLEKYSKEACQLGGDYLEIGSFDGGSTIRILEHMPIDRTLLCMDLWGNSHYLIFRDNMKRYDKWNMVCPFIGDYKQNLQHISRDKKLAFVFIDNDHTFINTAIPLCYLWDLLSEKGYMLFHDYRHPNYPGVEEFLSLCQDEPWNEVSQNRDGLFCLRKRNNISKEFICKIRSIIITRFKSDDHKYLPKESEG